MAIPVVANVKISGHRNTAHAVSKASDNSNQLASQRPALGPATIRPKDSKTKIARAMVRPIAIRRVFHHGRDSGTSYAVFKAETIDVMAPELLQRAPRMPIVSNPECSPDAMLANCFCTSSSTSGGAIGANAATTWFRVFQGR